MAIAATDRPEPEVRTLSTVLATITRELLCPAGNSVRAAQRAVRVGFLPELLERLPALPVQRQRPAEKISVHDEPA